MAIDTGEPAFPNEGGARHLWNDKGMTLRDYFAAKAMQGLVAAGKYTVGMGQKSETTQYAEKAYRQADAMLRVRTNTGEK